MKNTENRHLPLFLKFCFIMLVVRKYLFYIRHPIFRTRIPQLRSIETQNPNPIYYSLYLLYKDKSVQNNLNSETGRIFQILLRHPTNNLDDSKLLHCPLSIIQDQSVPILLYFIENGAIQILYSIETILGVYIK